MYTFDFRSSRNPWPSWMGSLHGYEIESVFGLSFDPALYYSSADREMSQNVMKYMTNFAKTGYVYSLYSTVCLKCLIIEVQDKFYLYMQL